MRALASDALLLGDARIAVVRGLRQISLVYPTDAGGALAGTVPLFCLLRAVREQQLSDPRDDQIPSVGTDAELREVARLMTVCSVAPIPVVDNVGRPLGLIAVDDILERLLPDT
jgi:Mg/Co/Ni transporter MgtE